LKQQSFLPSLLGEEESNSHAFHMQDINNTESIASTAFER
jgi:hypothetical protein